MARVMKSHFLDDRYTADGLTCQCVDCTHVKSYADHKCSAYPEELPPEYWNAEKKCPKREEKTDH